MGTAALDGWAILGQPVRKLARKLFRYATVSVISTSTSLVILGTLVATGALSPGWANVVATAVGTVPSFELNRRWVWGKAGRRSLGRELGPFWALSFAGLGLSTLAVSLAAATATSLGFGNTVRTLAAEGANVATFGCLWVLQYFVLDRLLFRSAERGAAARGRGQARPGGSVAEAPRAVPGPEAMGEAA